MDLHAPSDGMKDFAQFVEKKRRAEEESEREKDEKRSRREVPNDKKSCCVCLDHPATSAFVPCGHMVTCDACALEMEEDGQCPICRGPIAMILKIFT